MVVERVKKEGGRDIPAAEVAAVLALHCYVFCAGELGCEDVGPAGEEEEHDVGCVRVLRWWSGL